MQFTHEHEIQVLETALQLIAEGGWCKDIAKNAKGLVWSPQGVFVPVKPSDPKSEVVYVPATEWSLGGAIMYAEVLMLMELGDDRRIYPSSFRTNAKQYVEVVLGHRGYNTLGCIANFNDPDKSRATRVKQDVVDVLVESIYLAKDLSAAKKSS